VAAIAGPRVARFAEFESLRGVAAVSILVFHCWLFTSAAVLTWNLGPFSVFMQPLQSGVTLFFVLSGFLLYRPFAAALLGVGSRDLSLARYFRNRALRIVPAYLFVLGVTGFLLQSAVTGSTEQGVAVGAFSDPQTVFSDLFLVQTYQPATIWTGILPAWSLTVEVAFYLLLPLLVYGASKLVAHRGAVAAAAPVATMLGLGLAGKVFVTLEWGGGRVSGGTWHAVLDRSLLTHADLFAFGMAAALVFILCEERAVGAPAFVGGGAVGRVLAYLGVPTLVLGFYFLPAYAYDALVAFFCALLLLRVSTKSVQSKPHGVLQHPWAMACGRVSYSIFLWNFPVLIFLQAHGVLAQEHGASAFVANLGVTLGAVLLLSFVTYRFVEHPALRWKHQRRTPRTPLPAA
jgi:peptidoglycan/LPS O-acetylase OafA/YrhL